MSVMSGPAIRCASSAKRATSLSAPGSRLSCRSASSPSERTIPMSMPPQEKNIVEVLLRSLADQRQDAQAVALVKDEGHIVGDLDELTRDCARDHRHRAGVRALGEGRPGLGLRDARLRAVLRNGVAGRRSKKRQ